MSNTAGRFSSGAVLWLACLCAAAPAALALPPALRPGPASAPSGGSPAAAGETPDSVSVAELQRQLALEKFKNVLLQKDLDSARARLLAEQQRSAKSTPDPSDTGSTGTPQAERAKTLRLEKELDDTKQQLRDEVSRSKALEQQIAGLNRQIAALGGTGATVGAGLVTFMSYPARKVNNLGMVEAAEVRLAAAVGAKSVRLISPAATDDRPSFLMENDAQAASISLTCSSAEGKVVVGALRLKPEGLFLAWNKFSPVGMDKALSGLEGCLRRSVIEVSADGKALAKYQFAPETVVLKMPRTGWVVAPRLPQEAQAVTLESDETGVSWKVEAPEKNKLRFTQERACLTVLLDDQSGQLRAGWEDLTKARLKEIEEEMTAWQKDLERAKQDKARAARNPYGVFGTGEDPDVKIAQIQSHIDQLTREKTKLGAEAAKPLRTSDLSTCGARIVSSGGVILYRIRFE